VVQPVAAPTLCLASKHTGRFLQDTNQRIQYSTHRCLPNVTPVNSDDDYPTQPEVLVDSGNMLDCFTSNTRCHACILLANPHSTNTVHSSPMKCCPPSCSWLHTNSKPSSPAAHPQHTVCAGYSRC
jgi:hypothetical protein